MKIKNEYIDNAIRNVRAYYKKEVSIGERMSANLQELASFAASVVAKDIRSRGLSGSEISFAEQIPSICADEAEQDVLEANTALVRAKLAADEGAYLADFCKKTTAALSAGAKLRPSPALFAEQTGEKRGNKVCFAESRVLTTAFSYFQREDSSLTPIFVRSFADACEEVSADLADYCILPIENSREGDLLTVYGLIERYELFIARVCSIETDGIVTKYALLCRGFRDIMETDQPQYVAIRLSGYDKLLWSRLHTGACVLGAEIVKTVSVPLGYTDGYAHICTFFGSSEVLFALLLFLSAIRADYTTMGAYKIIQ